MKHDFEPGSTVVLADDMRTEYEVGHVDGDLITLTCGVVVSASELAWPVGDWS